MGLVLETTVFIGAERQGRTVRGLLEDLRARFGNEELAISVITAAELVHGIWRASSPRIRAAREEFVEEVFSRIPAHSISLRSARIAGQIEAQLRARGKPIPTADLFIGVAAIEMGFALVTSNLRHFRRIRGLKVARFA